MHTPYLLLDVDGVLLDWLSGFEKYLQHHAPHVYKPFTGLSDVDNLEQLLGMDSDQMHAWIDQFHHDDQFARLTPLPGAQTALKLLAPWCRMVCITASGSSNKSSHMRKQNLTHVFGDIFENVICVDRSMDKPAHLQSYPPGYWVEDQLPNAIMGLEAAHTSFLMDAVYNKRMHHDQIPRVENMLEVGMIMLSQSRSKFL